MFENVSFVQKN